jgi:hypothetical protein
MGYRDIGIGQAVNFDEEIDCPSKAVSINTSIVSFMNLEMIATRPGAEHWMKNEQVERE